MAAADPSPHTGGRRCDVLVVGGGPAGSAAGYWLALHGHTVIVAEKKHFPRDKTCGDGLTPRAVHQLDLMGLGESLTEFHRIDGLRATGHGRTLELAWPQHTIYPSHGYVVRRRVLDSLVADHAASAGATVISGCEVVAPLMSDGLVRGATVRHTPHPDADAPNAEPWTEDIEARYVIVADGANSRFGRALGTRRNKSYPQGMAIRTYYESPLDADPWIESSLDVRDRNGNSMPGYGWIFPVGDGTINVGIGLLSTFRDYTSVNTTHLMTEWAHTLPEYWGIDPDAPTQPPTGGRLPMAGSVGPKAGPTWLVVGDAAGSVNPFNGEGIDYAYETAAMAATLIDEALRSDSGLPLSRYEPMLRDEYGLYFKVARLFTKIIGRPVLMRELTRVGMRSKTLMEWVLRIMANLLRDDERGPAEIAYRSAAALARVVPDPDTP